MSVVTVSRQRGSTGSYIALDVAEQLGLRYLDREILDSVARQAGVSTEAVQAIEDRAGRLARVLHLLGARPKLPSVASASLREQETIEEQTRALMESTGLERGAAAARLASTGGLAYTPPTDYLDLVTSVISDFAAKGQAMIVGRGGQMILRQQPGVVHVQVIASFETRVYNIIQREGVKWREAAHRVRLSDEQRAGYMRRFYNVDWLDSGLYDLVISTEQIAKDVAVAMIIQVAKAVEAAAETGD
jgi:cytidylate kinase